MLKPEEAKEMGFTHEGSYWGIPVYIGDLEFAACSPIMVTVKYWGTDLLFGLFNLIEMAFSKPNAPSRFLVMGEIACSTKG